MKTHASRRHFLRAATAMAAAAGPGLQRFSAPFATSLAGMAALGLLGYWRRRRG